MARRFGAKNGRGLIRIIVLSLLLTGIASCSGGGGDEGGGSGSVNDGTKRTTKTGIRILHGALDIEPVDLKIGEEYFNHTAFMDVNFYAGTPGGSQLVNLERANSPGVSIFNSPIALAEKTEYSLLLSGQASHNNFQVTVLEEPIARPESGFGRVQLINLLEGSPPLILGGGGVTLGPVPFRLASGYVDIVSGAQTFTVTNERGGVLASVATTVPDRGEVTVVLGGFTSENVIIARVFTDLD